MEQHIEFKYLYEAIEARAEDIASSLRELPTDYKLAERCTDIDLVLEDIKRWYERRKRDFEEYELDKKFVFDKVKLMDRYLNDLKNDVENLKLQESSHDQHGGSYSQLSQIRRP